MLLLLSLLGSNAHAEDCEGPAKHLADAEQFVLEARLQVAREALADAEKALACGGPADRELLGRQWLLEGAVETFAGEEEAAGDAFAAARRVAPDLWLPALGDKLRASWEATGAREGAGTIELSGGPDELVAVLDGQVVQFPAEGAPGLHLVQVGASEDDLRFARIVFVPPGQAVTLRLPEVAWVDPPAGSADALAADATSGGGEPGDSGPDSGLFFHGALGGAAAFGQSLRVADGSGGVLEEPGTKVMVPVELGLTVRPGDLWFRAAAGAGVLVDGMVVFAVEDGARGWPVLIGGHGAAGLALDSLDLGLLGGIGLPGRISGRAVAGIRPADAPLRIELRPGVNLTSAGNVEPAVELLLAIDPS